MSLPLDDGYDLIKKAIENHKEEMMWSLYVNIYPQMDKEHYVSFEDFCKKSKQKEQAQIVDTGKSTSEMIAWAEKVKKADIEGR